MTTFNTRMTRGQTKAITVTVRDSLGRLADLTDAKAYFAMRADIKIASSVLLTSDHDLPGEGNAWREGIVILDQTGSNRGKFTITLVPDDTSELVAMGDDDPWIWDAWIDDPTLGKIPVIEQSTMGLYPPITILP